ncbi:right-handed parallel beta-helix repeat-containing protein [Paenibacillus sp. LHD-38]|uniref:right-handed parallel beta-helix repeat-containing protein n=1 Tax=Paenibacillus sp. LHD-38 TaxID=3072143 RepID=UPI00280DAA6C|nr:AAA family ATPase [Paenibacillus sp. LHD-38]MDQ8738629.1 AAA family ATPase [Paenibacillus sp. LHD-38]
MAASNRITVSPVEEANFRTIAEAVHAAEPGDTIVVHPGIYRECIVVEKQVKIMGSGSLGQVILIGAASHTLEMKTIFASVENIMIDHADEGEFVAVYIVKGSPLFEQCEMSSKAGPVLSIGDEADPIIKRCKIHSGQDAGVHVTDGGQGLLVDCDISYHKSACVVIERGGDPVFRRCRIYKGGNAGVLVTNQGRGSFESCDIFAHTKAGLAIIHDGNPKLSHCRIYDGHDAGVFATERGQGILEDCKIYGNEILNVAIKKEANPQLRRCQIFNGKQLGLLVADAGLGILEDCEIYGHAGEGLWIKDGNPHLVNCIIHDHSNIFISNTHISPSSPGSGDRESLAAQLQELEGFVAMESMKQTILDLVDYIEYVKDRQRLGMKTADSLSLHALFVGNPGTGKTTVARLLGKLYKAMGLLEKGHVVEVDRTGLVAEYVGQTAMKTERAIQSAVGGILFIDEAYTLAKSDSGQDYGKEAIEVILKRMEDLSGQFVVIAAGYPREMKTLIDINPGLRERFKQTIFFPDYTPDELLRIARHMALDEEYILDSHFEALLYDYFMELFRNRDLSFGNARLVRNCFEKVKLAHSRRCVKLPKDKRTREVMTTILPEDMSVLRPSMLNKKVFIPIDEPRLNKVLQELQNMVGLHTIKKSVNELVKLIRYAKESGQEAVTPYPHLLFLGNPGTGKTTVARLFSEIYAALGILSKGHLVEASREHFVSALTGHTEQKTANLISDAIGGVLFIDEAYTLRADKLKEDYGQIAIDLLVKKMEDYRGELIVIAAGYTQKMQKFVKSNPGLQSRFSQIVYFEDYDPNELLEITERLFTRHNYVLSGEAEKKLCRYYEEIYHSRDMFFGNARLARNIVEEALRNAELRHADGFGAFHRYENEKKILIADIAFLDNIG